MNFNFAQFMQALSTLLPVIGQAVEQLHPGDNTEALKIATGTALIGAFTQVATAASSTPAA